MRCAKCKAELKTGCMYCSVCGQEAQIVSDYNLLEDDFLREMLKEETKEKKETRKKPAASKKKRNKRIVVITGSILCIIIVIVLLLLILNYNRHNSFDYQMEQAASCENQKKYGKAEQYLKRAVELDETNLEVRLKLAGIYIRLEEKDSAIDTLKEVLTEDNNCLEAYEQLIGIYAEVKDYESITELSRQSTAQEILELFQDYVTDVPVFHPKAGKYHERTGVELSVSEECSIYFTLDGSDPKKGTRYQEPIILEPGETTVRTIACNKLGIYSNEVKAVYKIEFKAPDQPKVNPDGGSFSAPQWVTVTVPDGCSVYYTWDGSKPDVNSEKYTDALEIPVGNNILSLIVADENNMYSDVLKCNYIYIPIE